MNRIGNFVINKVTWKIVAVFTVLFAVVFIVINYSSIGVAGLLRITGGANILDFEFGYSNEGAYQMLTALGADGRIFYLTQILPMDFLLPLSYMLFYVSIIALLIKHSGRHRYYCFLLCIPVLAAVSDWIENIGIISMLRNYPILPVWAVVSASCAGIIKTVCTMGSIAAIGMLLCIFIYRKIRKERV